MSEPVLGALVFIFLAVVVCFVLLYLAHWRP
jgi:hypothetical protein